MGLKGDTGMSPRPIRDRMIEVHIPLIDQPAAAVANGYYVGAINRVGSEAPWNIGTFYGSLAESR